MPDTEASRFSKRQQAILAGLAFVILTALLAYGLIRPDRFETPLARFILCAAIAVYFSVFFFVFYPGKYELERIPVLDLPLKTTGPVVLWVIVLLMLLKLMPTSPEGYSRFFDVSGLAQALDECQRPDDRCSLQFATSFTSLEFSGGKDTIYYLVPDPRAPRSLAGVYVKFAPGDDRYVAVFRYYQKKATVAFSRYGEATAEVLNP